MCFGFFFFLINRPDSSEEKKHFRRVVCEVITIEMIWKMLVVPRGRDPLLCVRVTFRGIQFMSLLLQNGLVLRIPLKPA